MSRRAACVGVVIVGALLSIGAGAAQAAEEQSPILRAYGLDWIARVQEEAWPQAPEQRPVICLLDTGVNITPDTPADNPYGPIVARLALDGGSGTAQGTTFQHLHGTQMATVIGAPRNGTGTIGVFPQARIVSIRVTEGDAVYITPGAVRVGVRTCRTWAYRAGVRLAVVAIAEANYAAREEDQASWYEAGNEAAQTNAVAVAAAGNDASSQIVPLGVSNVVSVTAGDESGAACEFVADLPQTGGLRGPGCGAGWPAGSSAATATVAGVVGALVARDPTLTAAAARGLVTGASVATGDQRLLRAGALQSRFAGFVLPASTAGSTSSALSGGLQISVDRGEQLPARLWQPRLTARWRSGRLVVTRSDRRGGTVLAIQRTAAGSVWRVPGRRLTLRLPRRPRTVRAWVESGRPAAWRSLAVRLKVQ